LRPFFHIRRIPLRMSVELRWLRTVGLAETDWLSLAPGISLSLTPPHWPLRNELRLQAGVMSVLIEAIRGDQQESARAWRLGARAGLDLVIPFSSHLALLLAGDVGFWSPQLRLDVAGEPVGVSDLP